MSIEVAGPYGWGGSGEAWGTCNVVFSGYDVYPIEVPVFPMSVSGVWVGEYLRFAVII